jgi:hypothetical protein
LPGDAAALDGEALRVPLPMIRRAARNSAAVSELEELIRSYIIRSTMLICCLLLCTRPFGSRFCLGGWGARRTQLERLEPHPELSGNLGDDD